MTIFGLPLKNKKRKNYERSGFINFSVRFFSFGCFVVQLVYNRFSGAPASQTQKTKHENRGKLSENFRPSSPLSAAYIIFIALGMKVCGFFDLMG